MLGFGTLQLDDCGCSHLHYFRSGPKEEDQNMGSYDRIMR